MRQITVAVTSGDPCGVGPEVILKAFAASSRRPQVHLVVVGDLPVFQRIATRLHRRLPPWQVVPSWDLQRVGSGPLTFLDCGHTTSFIPGSTSQTAGRAALDYLAIAVALWKAKRLQALVTGPVTKWAIARVLPGFTGQTEYLARALGVRREVVMLFVSDRLRVALLTRHVALSRVPRAMTKTRLHQSIRLTAQGLTAHFGIARPRLALCGLNPHAGEASRTSEERAVMQPVLRTLGRAGIRCEGPFAADGLFARRTREYDAVICAYHDQGLIPFKMAARDRGCQLSVGLPLVRTSPDHGSALDIAGRGIAEPGSMRYALNLAIRLARRHPSGPC